LLINIGIVSFDTIGAFFGSLGASLGTFFGGLGGLMEYVWPAALIAFGIILLVGRRPNRQAE
jgi:hypothetical protein